MMNRKKLLKLTLLMFCLYHTISYCVAQKLPNVQQVSLRASAEIKIDGKAKEWGEQFQAYNKATGVFYSIANDDENLYLVIYSNNQDITTKILNNGINICFNAKKKSIEESLLIKYPIAPSTRQEINERNSMVTSKLSEDSGKKTDDQRKTGRFTLNKNIVLQSKYLKIFGINSTKDTLFSIYDSKDIMVRMDCPEQNILYYELSVPLKYLEISPLASLKLNYNIRLNENRLSHYAFLQDLFLKQKPPGGNDPGTIIYATDFWGEYTLAK